MTVILPLGRNRNLIDVPNKPAARTNLGLGSTDSPTFAGATLNGNINQVSNGTSTYNNSGGSSGTVSHRFQKYGTVTHSADGAILEVAHMGGSVASPSSPTPGTFFQSLGFRTGGTVSTNLSNSLSFAIRHTIGNTQGSGLSEVNTDLLTTSTATGIPAIAIRLFGQSAGVGVPVSIGFGTNYATVLRSATDHILEQRNGTNGQRFRVFKTFTSTTNGEWFEVDAAGNASNFDIAACIGSAGGVARGIRIGGKDAAGTFSPWMSISTAGVITINQPSLENSIVLTTGSNPTRPGIAWGGLSTGIYGGSSLMGISLSGTSYFDVRPTQVTARAVPFVLTDAGIVNSVRLTTPSSGVLEVRNGDDSSPGSIICGDLTCRPSTSRTLAVNLQLTIERVSNTEINLVYRGSDGTTRRLSLAGFA
jgi:hypothetical protein